MFAPRLQQAIELAAEFAKDQKHQFITLNHMMLALLKNPSAMHVLEGCVKNLDVNRFGSKLMLFACATTPRYEEEAYNQNPIPTAAMMRVLSVAEAESKKVGRESVTGADVLLAMFGEYECDAVKMLLHEGLNRFNAVSMLSKDVCRFDLA